MEDELISRAISELDSADLDVTTQTLVLSALLGEQQFTAFLDGMFPTPRSVAAAEQPPPPPPRTYLSAISIRGFRGIGPHATLKLTPGPGLTLIVGRNGSGKSSFAEGLEHLLTGTSKRWADKKAVEWRSAWRNLHLSPGESVKVSADFHLDKKAGTTRLTTEWAPNAELDGHTESTRTDPPDADPVALSWASATEFRPILTYPELAQMAESGPSALHDSLASILGLDALHEVVDRLADCRKRLETRTKALKSSRVDIVDGLIASDDPRAIAVRELFAKRSPDLDAIESIAVQTTANDTQHSAALRRLVALSPPTIDSTALAVADVKSASDAVAQYAGTTTESDATLATLLAAALAHHSQHGDQHCPVCGGGELDATWRASCEVELDRLRRSIAELTAAERRQTTAVAGCRAIATSVPRRIDHIDGISLDELNEVLAQVHEHDDPVAALSLWPDLVAAVDLAQEQARVTLSEIDAAWRPLASRVVVHVAEARALTEIHKRTGDLKKAEAWLTALIAEIRDERFAPIKDEVRSIWSTLRCASNVTLDDITLAGARTRRRVELAVSVDGERAQGALGVMSQGELNALAISLFLPRATLPDSPFGFVVIDDPVQAMDPARVDGLARVLETAALTLQVVVFTHDERLPDAVRNLGIEARVTEVVRGELSHVTTAIRLDPISRLLDDARAITRSNEVDRDLVERVAAGICRQAVEAAAVEKYRRDALARGTTHSEIEAEIDGATKFVSVCALGLWGDAQRGGEVLRYLSNKSRALGDAAGECARGAHDGAMRMEPRTLVRDVQRLCELLGWSTT